MEDNYSKAYKEVIEILNYVPQESVDKIPKNMIDTFRENMDRDYNFEVDVNKKFDEQNLLEETKAILANIFRDYWATPYQRERIEAKEKYDRQKLEEGKSQKYNPNDIFKNSKIEINCDNQKENVQEVQNLPIEVKKENFFVKIIVFFKRMFYIS